MPDYSQYPARQVIRRHEFSVRHMILEELKFRMGVPGVSQLDRVRLAWIADGVMVEGTEGKFIVTLYDVPAFEMEQSKLHLYVRGDTNETAKKQAQLAETDGNGDPFLEQSRVLIGEVVDALLRSSRQVLCGSRTSPGGTTGEA